MTIVLKSIRETGQYKLPNTNGLSEEQRRRLFRDATADSNIELFRTAGRDGGVRDYKLFNSHGYKGLYGGKSIGDLEKRRRLKKGKGLDHMGEAELQRIFFA